MAVWVGYAEQARCRHIGILGHLLADSVTLGTVQGLVTLRQTFALSARCCQSRRRISRAGRSAIQRLPTEISYSKTSQAMNENFMRPYCARGLHLFLLLRAKKLLYFANRQFIHNTGQVGCGLLEAARRYADSGLPRLPISASMRCSNVFVPLRS